MLYQDVPFYPMRKSIHLVSFQVELAGDEEEEKKDILDVILLALQLPGHKVAFIIIDFTFSMSTPRGLEAEPKCGRSLKRCVQVLG